MRPLLPLSPAFSLLLAGLAACNLGPGTGSDDDSSSGDDDDDTSGDDDTAIGPRDSTIFDLTDGTVGSDTLVTVTAVVTSPLYVDEGDGVGNFWIQDTAGGPGSGIAVYTFDDVLKTLEVAPGDAVELTGVFTLAFDYEMPEIRLDAAADLVVTGLADLPDPHPVTASEVDGGTSDRQLWGVVVEVGSGTVTSGPSFDSYGVWELDGVLVDDLFFSADVAEGYAVDRAAGVLTPWFGDVTLLPRWSDDVEFSHPGCDDAWTSGEADIQGLNCNGVPLGEELTLEGLVVNSPVAFFGDAFFAQDPGNAPFSGVQVYGTWDGVDAPEIGTLIDVTGEGDEFRGQTEIVVFDEGDIVEGGAGNLSPVEVLDPCAIDESWEGMLVHVAALDVVAQDEDGADFGYYEVDGCPTIHVASMFFAEIESFNADTGGAGTITDLTGVVSDRYEVLSINPRGVDDWATWGP